MPRPPFDPYPTLWDDTIVLRQIARREVAQVLSISFYEGQPATTVAEAAAMLASINEDYRAGTALHWGIEDKATRQLVGTCGYYRGFENERGELGGVLLPPFRGRGYMAKALLLAIEFGRNELALKAIVAITTPRNRPATRLLRGLAFRAVAALPDGAVEYAYPLEDLH